VSDDPIVIVGAGVAAHRAAEVLRGEGYAGGLVIFGDEAVDPYDRPPLTKHFLDPGAMPPYLRPSLADLGVDLRREHRVSRVDTGSRRVLCAGGESQPYQRLLIAVGAAPRRLPAVPARTPGVHELRTLHDALALRAELGPQTGPELGSGRRTCVIGAGFIGCEVAASLRRLGHQVTLVEAAQAPMDRVLGAGIGDWVARWHRAEGVDVRLGVQVAASSADAAGRIASITLSDGSVVPADLVIVAIGVCARGAELAPDLADPTGGLAVDEWCRTADPDVYAAGDCAQFWHPGYRRRLRLEHWTNARDQAAAAALSMLGRGAPYLPVPYFWSAQYDFRLQLVGHGTGWDEIELDGDPAGRDFTARYLRDGQPVSVLTCNRPRVARQALIELGREFRRRAGLGAQQQQADTPDGG
jgi:NADPH-dependent 2,4-dienoyl-CoA reductase/sulfur reductase-like enzyme